MSVRPGPLPYGRGSVKRKKHQGKLFPDARYLRRHAARRTDAVQGAIAFAVALLLAVGEPLAGILMIDCLLIPVFLTLFAMFRK